MKCEIIRDLLPSYLDGLTSKESNMEIEEHLANCKLCSEILQQMQKELEEKSEMEKKKINPFRKFNRRMKGAVAAAVAICIALGGAGWKLLGHGFAIDPDQVDMEVRLEGNMLVMDFAMQTKGTMQTATMYDGQSAEVALRRTLSLPFDDSKNEFSWGIDLNLLQIESGEKLTVAMNHGELETTTAVEGDAVTIQNGDAGPTALLMFQEGDQVVGVTSAAGEKTLEEYTITVDYGKEKESYTMKELLEMAE